MKSQVKTKNQKILKLLLIVLLILSTILTVKVLAAEVGARNGSNSYSGKIKVEKKFENIQYDSQRRYMESETYYFKVIITGDFYCPEESDENYYSLEQLFAVDKAGENGESWVCYSPEIIWYDASNPPTYTVMELTPEQLVRQYPDVASSLGVDENTEYYYRLTSITNSAGVFRASSTRTITATNEPTLPGNPGETPITNPGGTTPTNPGGTTPTNPGGTTPTNPGGTTPTDPGGTTPTDPGVTTPTDPSGTTPGGTTSSSSVGAGAYQGGYDAEKRSKNDRPVSDFEALDEGCTGKIYVWWELADLDAYWYLICSEHGQSIPSGNYDVTAVCNGCGATLTINTKKSIHREELGCLGHRWTGCVHCKSGSYTITDDGLSNTMGYYSLDFPGSIEDYKCNPAEAYILAESAHKYPGNHLNSIVQQAWWNTWMGHIHFGGDPGSDNGLWKEAAAFQSYICELLGVDDPLQEIQWPYGHVTKDWAWETLSGTDEVITDQGTVDAAFDIKYEPIWYNVDGKEEQDPRYNGGVSKSGYSYLDVDHDGEITEADKVTYSVEPNDESSTGSYLVVGPYSIEYLERNITAEDRDRTVHFSKITKMSILTNLGYSTIVGNDNDGNSNNDEKGSAEDDLNRKDESDPPQPDNPVKWKMRFVEGTGGRGESDKPEAYNDYIFPHCDEVFYLLIEYVPELTVLNGIDVEFRYMNASAIVDAYKGYWNKYTWETWTAVCCTWPDGSPKDYKGGLKIKEIEDKIDSQAMVYVDEAVRWYSYTDLSRNDGTPLIANITIEKELVDEAGNRITVDGEYSFNIYIDYQDGEGEKLFETLTVLVKDGYGKKVSQNITWEGEGFALVLGRDEGISKKDGYDPVSPVVGKNPTYRVEEIEPDGSTLVSIENAEGTLAPYTTVEIYAKNTLEPHKGKIKVKKEFTNILHELQKEYMEGQKYYFKVGISGLFKCESYSDEVGEDPSTMYTYIEWIVSFGAGDDWQWETPEIIWYDENNPPTYKVDEIYPDKLAEQNPDEARKLGIDPDNVPEYYYKLSSISNASGVIIEAPEDNPDVVATVIAVNEPTLKVTTLELNKEILDNLKPDSGDEFKVNLKIEIKDGGFDINGLNGKAYNKDNPYEQEITLSGPEWKSEQITVVWYDKVAPTYTVKEVEYPEKYSFAGIKDGLKSTTKNEFTNTVTDKLQKVNITIVNKLRDKEKGKISVIKRTETDDLNGQSFGFTIEVKGKFTYTGSDGTISADPEDATKQIFTYTGSIVAGGDPFELNGEFEWYAGQEKPTYTVTEHDLSTSQIEAGIEFVSISNDSKTVTNRQSITDSFKGEEEEKVVIRILNNQGGPKNRSGKIRIDKLTVGNIEYLQNVPDEELKFTFEVSISSKNEFVYTAPDGTSSRVVNDTLNLSNTGVSGTADVFVTLNIDKATGKTDVWTSGEVTWDENSVAPTFSIREVEIPDWAVFKSWRTATTTVETTKIIGNISEGITANTLTAINEIVEKYQYGSLKIIKKAATINISGQEFKFTLTVNGHFWYNDVEHKATDEPLKIEEISVVADDENGWSSGTFRWLYTEGAPTYTVVENLGDDEESEEGEVPTSGEDSEEEEDPYEGVEVISISNGLQSNSDNAISGSIPGRDNLEDTDKAVVTITAINKKEPKHVSGYIQLEKKLVLDGNEFDSDRRFTFMVTLTYHDKFVDSSGNITVEDREEKIPVSIKAGQKSRIVRATWWDYEDAPNYEIEEIGDDDISVTWSEGSPSGELLPNDVVYLTAENTFNNPHKGKLAIEKKIEYNNKLSTDDIKNLTEKFTFNVYVTGTFTYAVGDSVRFYDNTTMQLKVELNMAENVTWTSEGEFTWYGDEVPSYAIEEVNLPNGIYLKSIENGSGKLSDGTVKATCTNKIELREVILLTLEMAGRVWDDTDYSEAKDADRKENGLIDEGEAGMEGIRVRVYRVVTNGAGNIVAVLDGVYLCPDNNVLAGAQKTTEKYAETFTDSFGNWSFGTLSVPGFDDEAQAASYSGYTVSYDVRFDYDGQTYEPTTFLATTLGSGGGGPVGNSDTYIHSSTSERDDYLNDSMAYDQINHVTSSNSGLYDGVEDRDTFNNKFATIEGQDPIDENGKTLGKTDGGIDLHYSSTDSSSYVGGNNTRKISTLDLYDEDGELYEDYLITATTSTGALTYPFDKNIHLASWDKKVMWFGISTEYVYSATYNYMQHINLGLIKREAADLAIEKDLTEAVVVVNGKVLKYKYNSAIDLDDPENMDLLYKQIQVADEQFEYKLGLYSSDYYYRASIYGGSEAEGPMNNFYVGTMGYSSLKDLEMEVYLKYTINVYNESDTYTAEVKELADYHDETLSLVTSSAETARYVKTLNGVEVNDKIELAEAPQMTIYGVRPEGEDGELGEAPIKVDKSPISWSDDVETIEDERHKVTYIKMTTTGLEGQKLESGERAELTVTFKIDKSDSIGEGNLIEDEIKLGEKHNVVEITKFSSYYSESSKNKWQHAIGEVTGRIDEDSAPDNVNIKEHNEKNWYEDDTDSAPSLYVYLYNTQRNINGIAWEDAQTNQIGYNQVVGDGLYNPDQGDKNIPNMTVELVESILIPNTTGPGATYTEYEFIWPTAEPLLSGKSVEEVTGFDSTMVTNNAGIYVFSAVPAGNYKVRFVYGDKDIRTENTVDELYYNGQDYKSTAYQIGYDNDADDDYYVDNEWHDLTNNKLTAERVSDARDSEARRLWITAKSEMLYYKNTSILATADELHSNEEQEAINEAIKGGADVEEADELHKELYGSYNKAKEDGSVVTGTGYYMYADTAKLNIEVENVYKINYTTETIGGETEEEAGDGDKLIYTLDGDIEKGAVKLGNTFVYDINNIDFGLEERSQTKLTLDKQIKEIKLTTPDGNVILDAIYDIYYDLGEDDNIEALVTLSQLTSTNYNQIASLNRTRSSQGYRYIMAESTILQGTTITITYQLSVFNVGEADTCNIIMKKLWSDVNKDLSIESIEGLLEETKGLFNSGSGGGSTTAGKLAGILSELTSPYYTEEKGRLTFDQSDKYEYGKYVGNIYYLGTQGTYITDEVISENERLSEDDKIMLVEITVHQMIDYVDPDVEFRDTDNVELDKSWSTTTIQYLIDNELISPEAVIIVNNATGIPETQTDSDGQLKPVTYADRAINESTEHYAFVNDEIKEFITYDDDGEIIKNNVILSVDQGANPEDPDEELTGTNPGLVRELIPYTAAVRSILDRKEAEGADVSDVDVAVEIMDEAKKESTALITLDVSRYYASEEDGEDVDNLAEIIKYENTVGRRDIRAIAGNTSTYELEKDAPDYTYTVGLYQIAGKEPDTSATEVVTLTPPTGLDSSTKLITQIVIITIIAGLVLAVGIVLIRKRVLKNRN